jgi:D-aminopeptidase
MRHLLWPICFPVLLAAQTPATPPPKLPPPEGGAFRVMIIPDMEGMGSAVDIHEVIAGNEGEQYRTLTSDDYWQRFRGLLTQEVNAVITGARSAGARSFVVNEGHGGNLFANVLPWDLDTAAILVRGFPKPLIMITGIDSTVGTLIFTGAHAGAGRPGVLSHNFAFDAFTVNGTTLNEVGINALIASEYGVAVSMVTGDDALIRDTRAILGNDFVGVVTKYAVGRMAAITFSPARVRRMLQDSAAVAVRRAMNGAFKPDAPPDELDRAARAGLHFGFPFCHGGTILDPDFGAGHRCADYVPPEQPLGAHVAALGMRFYTGTMFPPEYRGQIFIAEHGSWNRVIPVGYRITLVRLENGRAVSYEPFAKGWLRGGSAWGRPVDLLVMPDGALLVSDDKAGVVYRISYGGP